MKTKHILWGLLGWWITSCSDQDLIEKTSIEGTVQVTAGIVNSRVSFMDTGNVITGHWQNGDGITLSTQTQENLNYTAVVSEEDVVTRFVPQNVPLRDIPNELVYACYPAAPIINGTVELPKTDIWSDDKPLPFAYAISAIKDSRVDLQFHHVFSFLQLNVSPEAFASVETSDGDKTIHRFYVESSSDSLGIKLGNFSFSDFVLSMMAVSEGVEVGLSDNSRFENDSCSVYIPILPQMPEVQIEIYALHDTEEGSDTLFTLHKKTPVEGFLPGCVYSLNITKNGVIADGDNEVDELKKKEVHLEEAGTLSRFITEEEKYNIDSLIMSGCLNGADIRLIRDMSGADSIYGSTHTKGRLRYLDVGKCRIVKGGGWYMKDSKGYEFHTKDDLWGNDFVGIQMHKIVMPASITEISSYAFSGSAGCNWITFPEDAVLPCIHKDAFKTASRLEIIDIPASVVSIESYAFYYSSNLRKVTFASKSRLRSIGLGAFSRCYYLEDIQLPAGVDSIGEYAFELCVSLPKIDFSSGLPEFLNDSIAGKIGYWAFMGCTLLKEITIPSSITYLDNSFVNCPSLSSVKFAANSRLKVLVNSFQYCTSLSSIVLPDSVEILSGTFSGCTSLSSITFSSAENIKEIGENTFEECSALVSFTIPNSVEKVDGYVFYNCSSLKEITLPASIKSVMTGAFNGCTSLTKLVIEEGDLQDIQADAFKDVPLESCYNYLSTPTKIHETAFSIDSINKSLAKLYIPKGSSDAYKKTTWATFFSNIVEMDE